MTGTLAAILAHSFLALLTSRLIQGLGAASPRVIAVAIVRDKYQGRQMARVMSFTMMVFIMIPVLAPSAGQALLHFGDWHWTFYALLGLGAVVSVWAGFRLPETARDAASFKQHASVVNSLRAVVGNPQTLVYGSAGGVMYGCILGYVASAQQIFVEVFHLGDEFPIAFGAVASTMALAAFVNARWVERLGMRRVSHSALAAFVCVAITMVVLAVLNLAVLPVFLLLMASAFFLFGLIAPNFNALAMEPHGEAAGMALSTGIGAVSGAIVAHQFHGTVLPLTVGFALCSLISLGLVIALEGRGGLFGNRLGN